MEAIVVNGLYQIDDLVMASRQEIAPVVMESLGKVKR